MNRNVPSTVKPACVLVTMLITLSFAAMATAQHTHGILTPGVTFPKDDSVLKVSPQMITMSFRVDVQLLKLALYTDKDEWINIGFQYDPSRLHHSFVFPIESELPKAEFYVAKWSVTDERKRLMNGEFTFAFGDGAIPPSETIALRVSDKVEVLPATGAYRIGTEQ